MEEEEEDEEVAMTRARRACAVAVCALVRDGGMALRQRIRVTRRYAHSCANVARSLARSLETLTSRLFRDSASAIGATPEI